MGIRRRDFFVGASGGGAYLIGSGFLSPTAAQDAQAANPLLNALTQGASNEVEQILGAARREGVGPSGPIPAGGGPDPLALAEIVDNALNQDTTNSQLLARRTGVLLSALTTLAHESRDIPEAIPAGVDTSYAAMKAYYTNLAKNVVIDDQNKPQILRIATRINNNRDRYQEVQNKTGVPWFIIGALHYREANLNSLGHLHNGDNLLMLTVHVPANRPTQRPWPPEGESLRQVWTDSAVDAMREVPKFAAWSLQKTCWAMERYNGFGCYYHNINTPYLWNYTSNYVKGGYSGDGHYDATYVSKQAGLFTIMLGLKQVGGDLGPSFALEA